MNYDDERRLIDLRSWQLAAELIGRTEPQLFPICLHPGGGMYDCLYLYDARQNHPVIINRVGSVTLETGRTWLSPEWPGHVERDLEGFVSRIAKETPDLTLHAFRKSPVRDSPVAVSSRTIAGALAIPGMRAEPVWFDSSSEDAYVDEALLAPYRNAEEIMRAVEYAPEGVRPDFPPAAWLWSLHLDDMPARLINIRDAVSYRTDGTALPLS